MKVYVATPVNGRPGNDISDKRILASRRIKQMVEKMRERFPDGTEFVSSFDVAPLGRPFGSEAEIMGGCIRLVMESDLVVFDRDFIRPSRGMRVEVFTAETYGIKAVPFHDVLMGKRI